MKLFLDAVTYDRFREEEGHALCVIDLTDAAMAKLDHIEKGRAEYDFESVVSEDPLVSCTFYGETEKLSGALTLENDGSLGWKNTFWSGHEVTAEIPLEILKKHAEAAADCGIVLDCRHFIQYQEEEEFLDSWMDALPAELRAQVQAAQLAAKANDLEGATLNSRSSQSL